MLSLYLVGQSELPYRLYVLDRDLDVVYAWPNSARRSAYILGMHPFSKDIVHAWMPSDTLVTIVRPKVIVGTQSTQQALCWGEAEASDAKTEHQLEQLQNVGPGEAVISLVWDLQGMAAITELGSAYQSPKRLYLWLSDGSQASMVVHGRFISRFAPNTIQWSPAGDRLLLTCVGVQLISTSCTLLLQLPGELHGMACFSPCGRYLGVVHQISSKVDCVWSLDVYSSLDGRKLLAKALQGMRHCHRMTFSNTGDKVIITVNDAICVVQFGLVDGSCTGANLCQAVTAACQLITS